MDKYDGHSEKGMMNRILDPSGMKFWVTKRGKGNLKVVVEENMVLSYGLESSCAEGAIVHFINLFL